ncbi:MAG: hypothetical protein JNJ73_19220 [Hyphomonadaceae bacterium]|nr:hypothetical protein [Hyphomonadaceae bacterium]
MSPEHNASLICLSANGKTTSSSDRAPKNLLVATTESLWEFARPSADAPWAVIRDDILPDHHVSALLFEPRSGLIFAALHFEGGVLASADGGKTWAPRNNGLQSGHAYTLMVQYVGDKTILYLGTEPVMLYRSEDLGQSWTALPAVLDVADTDKWFFPRSVPHIKHIASHPSEPNTLYVCVEQGDILKSVDAGKSWRQLTQWERADDKFRRDMHRVVFRENDPKEIFMTTGIGLYHSTDAGETWERRTDTTFRLGYPDPFFIHPDKPNLMYMVGAGANPNPEWAKTGTANPLFMRSTDSGRTWTEAMNGMRMPVRGNIEAAAMHVSKENGMELFTGTACGELYESRDGADSWTLITDEVLPVSKGPHFRHFLTPEDREAYENKLRAMKAFA